jgi:hypothetical protein
MLHFVEPFEGWLVRVGPLAVKWGSPYVWSFPLSKGGEFCGFSTAKLTSEAKREAFKAAEELGLKPHWIELGEKGMVFW